MQGRAFRQFWSKKCQPGNWVLSYQCVLNSGPENEKIWHVLSRKRQLRALVMEKLVLPRVSFSQRLV